MDTLKFGAGISTSDVTLTLSGDDLVVGFVSTSTDSITVQNFITTGELDRIEFDDGTIWSSTDIRETIGSGTSAGETLTGTGAAEVLIGNGGNDTINGKDGSDTYVFAKGDGQDTWEDNGYKDNDRVVIQGYSASEINIQRVTPGSGGSLLLTFSGTSDSITINNTLSSSNADGIEQFIIGDGTVWTMQDMRDSILTSESTAGNDVISAFGTADTIEAGLGNDIVKGLDGSDTYVFNAGDGQDEIDDDGYKDQDKLIIHGYDAADVTVQRAGTGNSDDTLLTFSGSSDQIKIWNNLNSGNADEIESIVLDDDGTTWTTADLRTMILDDLSTSGNDTIHGFGLGDTLEGGLGDDTIHGMDGWDVYVFNAGDGQDSYEDNGWKDTDKVVIHGYTPAQTTVEFHPSGSGDDVLLTFSGSSDSISIWNTLNGSNQDEIEQIEFDDGTIWTTADLNTMATANAAPVVLDLDGDGVELTHLGESSVYFDHDGDGARERTGWVSADDALLVLDRNGDNRITYGEEISFVQDLPGAQTDLEGLVAYDSNGNGLLDHQDDRFGDFQLWQDANQNGVSEPWELSSLRKGGIESIDLAGVPKDTLPGQQGESVVVNTSSYTRRNGDGSEIADVVLRYSENDEIGSIPSIPFGHSLWREVMDQDWSLGQSGLVDFGRAGMKRLGGAVIEFDNASSDGAFQSDSFDPERFDRLGHKEVFAFGHFRETF